MAVAQQSCTKRTARSKPGLDMHMDVIKASHEVGCRDGANDQLLRLHLTRDHLMSSSSYLREGRPIRVDLESRPDFFVTQDIE